MKIYLILILCVVSLNLFGLSNDDKYNFGFKAGLNAVLKVIPSVKQDEKILESLKKKLDGLYGEINDLKGALLAEEIKSVGEDNPDLSFEEIEKEAERRVEKILENIKY